MAYFPFIVILISDGTSRKKNLNLRNSGFPNFNFSLNFYS
jgi:hypothetical protein